MVHQLSHCYSSIVFIVMQASCTSLCSCFVNYTEIVDWILHLVSYFLEVPSLYHFYWTGYQCYCSLFILLKLQMKFKIHFQSIGSQLSSELLILCYWMQPSYFQQYQNISGIITVALKSTFICSKRIWCSELTILTFIHCALVSCFCWTD